MSSIFIVSRITDASGVPDFEVLSAFSNYDEATKQAKIVKTMYGVEVSEVELDLYHLLPQGTATVATNE